MDARGPRRGAPVAVRLELEVGGRVRTVTVEASGSAVAVTLDGRPVDVDVARLGPGATRSACRAPDGSTTSR